VRRFPPDCLDPKIHHNNLIQSILAKIEANRAGADDAVMLDRDGFVAETNATHLFLVDSGGAVVTPTTKACPEGITRATVLELCAVHRIPAQARDVSLAEFYRAAEVFCTGTMGELAPVREIDGRRIGGGGGGDGALPGLMTRRLTELFRELTRTQGVPIV
jgi:branched-chain amino acid aminotransferase